MDSPAAANKHDIFVAVPSYNHAPFVEKSIRSIIGQTYRPKKLLVIDDGSRDDSRTVIEKALADCPFDSELISRENRGLCATLNQALEMSEGEYFAYLGSDDIWFPTFLEEQTTLLEERPQAVLAFCHAYLVDENDNVFDVTSDWTAFADGDMLPMLLKGIVFSSPGVVYRRSILAKHRWNERSKLEDYEMYLRLSAEGPFARNSKVLCAWRQHGENASGRLPAMFAEMLDAQDRLAADLDIDTDDLSRSQRRMKFAAVENFVRQGFRNEAGRLFLENVGGAASVSELMRTMFRLAVPQSLFQWNRRRKKLSAIERYGKLEDLMPIARDPR